MDNDEINFRERRPVESKTESDIKRQIYEKVRRRTTELQNHGRREVSPCPELNPDVIVISDAQSLLFEPQNRRALELLVRGFGLDMDGTRVCERMRVHPCKSGEILHELRTAGLNVVC